MITTRQWTIKYSLTQTVDTHMCDAIRNTPKALTGSWTAALLKMSVEITEENVL